MKDNNRKLKLTNKIKELGPKLKWVLFSGMQDYKLNSKYIDFICPEPDSKKVDSTEQLNEIVRESLIKEFSPEIQNTKYFDLLVDAVAHNIKKKAVND